ncbi:uncharacterized protein F5147DRAFT_761939 [Suillus discolor]|uniref:Uncharacterized protein n=1 Tax=Suillus discolor TaxID=1912936 RepID=A0A9P7F337_9AGAM|nr:uncharacterized protein F5147DRAFT_761939 [Suillus discolor]KAG2105507.1 hypothetical protein F5147DRAFT_761939 [Suillus discolor]
MTWLRRMVIQIKVGAVIRKFELYVRFGPPRGCPDPDSLRAHSTDTNKRSVKIFRGESIPFGHCGGMDVEDVAESVRELVKRGVSEEIRQLMMGGSHARSNIHASIMLMPTFERAYSDSSIPNVASLRKQTRNISDRKVETYNILFTASPITHVNNVTAPVLILIGEDDLRVVRG